MRRFEERVAFVTGGGHGIGRATAARLAGEGARVVVADIDDDAAGAAAREVGGGSVHCDVTDGGSVDAAIGWAVETHARLDVVVNTAGGDRPTPDLLTSDEPWRRLYDLNFTGVVRCVRSALPHLIEARGNVVTVGSVNGLAAFGSEPYSAAKAALTSLTQNLAARYGPAGVRFNLVAPGTIRTRNWDNQPGALERLSALYPLGRVGEPEDVAAAIAFLASDDAGWITGIVLPVEGGVLTGPTR